MESLLRASRSLPISRTLVQQGGIEQGGHLTQHNVVGAEALGQGRIAGEALINPRQQLVQHRRDRAGLNGMRRKAQQTFAGAAASHRCHPPRGSRRVAS